MTEDNDLLRLFADDGNDKAFSTLVRRRVDFVYATALRTVGEDDHVARVVSQRVFVGLAQKAPKLAGRPALLGWLHRSTCIAASKIARAERKRQTRTREAQIMSDIDTQSGRKPDWEQLKPHIDDSLAQLSENDREAILLRYFENLPLAEVGQCTGLSENAARMRVDHAMHHLRTLLGERGISSTSGVLAFAISHQPSVAAPANLASEVATAALGEASQSGMISSLGSFISSSRLGLSLVGVTACITLGAASVDHCRRSEIEEKTRALDAENKSLKIVCAETAEAVEKLSTLSSDISREISRVNLVKELRDRQEYEKAITRGKSLLGRFPDFLDQLKSYDRLARADDNRDFYESHQLSAAQIAAIDALEQEKASTVVKMVGLSGTPYLFPLGQSSFSQPEEQARITGILGSDLAKQYQEYHRELRLRKAARDVIGSIKLADASFDRSRSEELVAALASSSTSYGKGDSFDLMDIDWSEAQSRTQGLLSKGQFQLIQRTLLPETYESREKTEWFNKLARNGTEISSVQ